MLMGGASRCRRVALFEHLMLNLRKSFHWPETPIDAHVDDAIVITMKTKPKNHTARLIREARIKAKLTQAELGKRIDVPPSVISRWETGVYTPTIESIRELAKALGTRPGELIG